MDAYRWSQTSHVTHSVGSIVLCQPPYGSSVIINWMNEWTDMKYVAGDAERLAHGGQMGLLAYKQQDLEAVIFS